MTTASYSLTSLPHDILGCIAQHCDAKTLYALQATCRTAKNVAQSTMNVDIAARIVFHHPEQYFRLQSNELKKNHSIVLNALASRPSLFFDPTLPRILHQDPVIIKTAYVAAFFLHDTRTKELLWKRYKAQLENINKDLADWKRQKQQGSEVFLAKSDSELFTIQSFVQHGLKDMSFDLKQASTSIKKHLDLMLSHFKRMPLLIRLSDVDPSLLDNDEFVKNILGNDPLNLVFASDRLKDQQDIVEPLVHHNEEVFRTVSDRLKNTDMFIWDTLSSSELGIPFIEASQRIRNNFIFALIAAWKNAANLHHIGPELANTFLGHFLQSDLIQALFTLINKSQNVGREILIRIQRDGLLLGLYDSFCTAMTSLYTWLYKRIQENQITCIIFSSILAFILIEVGIGFALVHFTAA